MSDLRKRKICINCKFFECRLKRKEFHELYEELMTYQQRHLMNPRECWVYGECDELKCELGVEVGVLRPTAMFSCNLFERGSYGD